MPFITDRTEDGLRKIDEQALMAAAEDGFASAQFYDRGLFSESEFIRFGRLEQLVARGLLRRTGSAGRPDGDGDLSYSYELTARGAARVQARETARAA